MRGVGLKVFKVGQNYCGQEGLNDFCEGLSHGSHGSDDGRQVQTSIAIIDTCCNLEMVTTNSRYHGGPSHGLNANT